MFGVSQEQLVKALRNLAAHQCAYRRIQNGVPVPAERCDCKFGADEKVGQGELGNGCPELKMAAYLIQSLTPKQFVTLCKKAKVTVTA